MSNTLYVKTGPHSPQILIGKLHVLGILYYANLTRSQKCLINLKCGRKRHNRETRKNRPLCHLRNNDRSLVIFFLGELVTKNVIATEVFCLVTQCVQWLGASRGWCANGEFIIDATWA